MSRIFDCVILDDELDLLEARFREYEDQPDVIHVIAECTADYQGKPKPLHFWENRLDDRFFCWHGKWNHVRVEAHELPRALPKLRKNVLREFLSHGIAGEPGDVILHGNIDEIPAPWVMEHLLKQELASPLGMDMRWCAHRADLLYPGRWRGTVAHPWRPELSMSELREKRKGYPALMEAGTRLSLMGADGTVHSDGHSLQKVLMDGTWPRFVQNGCPTNWRCP